MRKKFVSLYVLFVTLVLMFSMSIVVFAKASTECKVCGREFEAGTEDYRSIGLRNMCSNCYSNYVYTQQLKDSLEEYTTKKKSTSGTSYRKNGTSKKSTSGSSYNKYGASKKSTSGSSYNKYGTSKKSTSGSSYNKYGTNKKSTSESSFSKYGSSNKYGSGGYKYDKNDKYYSANDHNHDGKINDEEFQDAMNAAIDDLLNAAGY